VPLFPLQEPLVSFLLQVSLFFYTASQSDTDNFIGAVSPAGAVAPAVGAASVAQRSPKKVCTFLLPILILQSKY
jgi:hypothetical protein